jgi:hypothetical protein
LLHNELRVFGARSRCKNFVELTRLVTEAAGAGEQSYGFLPGCQAAAAVM